MIVTVWVSVASLAIFALAWQELDDTGFHRCQLQETVHRRTVSLLLAENRLRYEPPSVFVFRFFETSVWRNIEGPWPMPATVWRSLSLCRHCPSNSYSDEPLSIHEHKAADEYTYSARDMARPPLFKG
jgi:hypothetical protein